MYEKFESIQLAVDRLTRDIFLHPTFIENTLKRSWELQSIEKGICELFTETMHIWKPFIDDIEIYEYKVSQ